MVVRGTLKPGNGNCVLMIKTFFWWSVIILGAAVNGFIVYVVLTHS
jgi:hypothetical protein